jgi:sugar transferase (PEP-CTERM/EpsH1 system associated)
MRSSGTAIPAAASAKRLRIMHVVHRFGTGGIETGIRRLGAALDPAEFEQIVCTVQPGGYDSAAETLPVVTLGLMGGGSLIGSFRRIFAAQRPDIVHSRNWATIEAIPAARWARIPRVIHGEHGRNLDDLGGEPLRRRIARRLFYEMADQVVTVSEELKAHYAATTHFRRDRISVIGDGVDTARFAPSPQSRAAIRTPLGLAADRLVVGSVGRLDPVKNYGCLLDAAGIAIRGGLELSVVLVGDGPERDALQARIAAAPELAGRVHFAGDVRNAAEWLNSFDVFVLPSAFEGISVALLEAMAVGLPCLASDVGGNGEVVVQGETGVLFPADDAGALARLLLDAASDPMRYRTMGQEGRKRVEAKFSFDITLARYAGLYRRVALSHVGSAS